MSRLQKIPIEDANGTSDETVFDVRDHQNGQPIVFRDNKLELHDAEEAIALAGDDTLDDSEKCGLLCCKPTWLQKFRNMKTFLLVFIITGLTQGR